MLTTSLKVATKLEPENSISWKCGVSHDRDVSEEKKKEKKLASPLMTDDLIIRPFMIEGHSLVKMPLQMSSSMWGAKNKLTSLHLTFIAAHKTESPQMRL